jgi:hypothetical protein
MLAGQGAANPSRERACARSHQRKRRSAKEGEVWCPAGLGGLAGWCGAWGKRRASSRGKRLAAWLVSARVRPRASPAPAEDLASLDQDHATEPASVSKRPERPRTKERTGVCGSPRRKHPSQPRPTVATAVCGRGGRKHPEPPRTTQRTEVCRRPPPPRQPNRAKRGPVESADADSIGSWLRQLPQAGGLDRAVSSDEWTSLPPSLPVVYLTPATSATRPTANLRRRASRRSPARTARTWPGTRAQDLRRSAPPGRPRRAWRSG